jgi:streptogramin lyase
MKLFGFKLSLLLILCFILCLPVGLGCKPGNGVANNEKPDESCTVDISYDLLRTYTTNDDFDQGELVGLEHDTIPDQLQLSEEQEILPFIWVPNMEGSVSKIDTITGNEVARYKTSPFPRSDSGSPSRTTVDLEGNCWVGNRRAGTVVKIGLFEMNNWIDRNGDGICQTSRDLNDDGAISADEILPWGEDECVLMEVVLVPGFVGTFVPGEYNGTYDRNNVGTAPRGLAVDSLNNLWASTYSGRKFYYIDGNTGEILRVEDFSTLNHNSYGAVIDRYGKIWSSGSSTTTLMRMDPSTTPATFNLIDFPYVVYGICLDYNDHLYLTHYSTMKLTRVNIVTMEVEWSKDNPNLAGARGLVATKDNHIWVAESGRTKVVRFDDNGTQLNLYEVGSTPTGVAVDSEGKVWACNLGNDFVSRIDPITDTVDLQRPIINSMGHYSYSDMTGNVVKTITTKTGTWKVIHDTLMNDAPWGKISWNSYVPEGTELLVKVRSSNDLLTWSDWEIVENEVMLTTTPSGRYLEIEVTLKLLTGSESPILYDLTVQIAMLPMKIDIKPWNPHNVINPDDRGILEVAILDDGTFDLSDIDLSKVYFGPNKAEPIRWKFYKSHHHYHHHGHERLEYIVFYFKIQDTGIIHGDTSAEMTAMLTNGIMLVGTDSIYTVPKHKHCYH